MRKSRKVQVPPSYDGSKPSPVVLALHAGGSTTEQMARSCGLNDKGDQAGFLVVYPNGTGRLARVLAWNGGNCCGDAMRNNVDDVACVRALLHDLGQLVNVDSKRVYATGMSNGAIMAYRLASELWDRIAAIAPVAGPMGTERCSPMRPVPVIHFHGTDDQFAPFQGGQGRMSFSGTNFFSVDHSIRAWARANGCPEEPTTITWPDRAKDGTGAIQKTYGPGKDGAEVVLFMVEGGGHTWPGREPPLRLFGKATRNVSANDLMWEFFEKHPMK